MNVIHDPKNTLSLPEDDNRFIVNSDKNECKYFTFISLYFKIISSLHIFTLSTKFLTRESTLFSCRYVAYITFFFKCFVTDLEVVIHSRFSHNLLGMWRLHQRSIGKNDIDNNLWWVSLFTRRTVHKVLRGGKLITEEENLSGTRASIWRYHACANIKISDASYIKIHQSDIVGTPE